MNLIFSLCKKIKRWRIFRSKIMDLNINKTKYMNLDLNKSDEELIEDFKNIEFQWIKGENTGGIEEFSHFENAADIDFLVFKSGTRLNRALIHEFVETFPKADIDLGGLPENIKSSTEIKNEKIPSQITESKIIPSEKYPIKTEQNSSPIYNLLDKQKPNNVGMNIEININLPTKELYSILIESFDNAKNDILEYIMSNLDMEEIKKEISDSVMKEYYGYKIIDKKINKKVKEIDGK